MNSNPQRWSWLVTLVTLLVAVLLVVGFLIFFTSPRLRSPSPEGMVLRIPVREVLSPLDRITVGPSIAGRSAIVAFLPAVGTIPEQCIEYSYPHGEERPLLSPPAAVPPPHFDFDGDGITDSIRIGQGAEHGLVQVISGLNTRSLFESRDPLEYENPARAFPLNDLDGDGCSELALVHPRRDRSAYDFHPFEGLFPVKSWITIISGSLASHG